MNRRAFLKLVGAAVIAPSLPGPKFDAATLATIRSLPDNDPAYPAGTRRTTFSGSYLYCRFMAGDQWSDEARESMKEEETV